MKYKILYLFIHFKLLIFKDFSILVPDTMKSENVSSDEIHYGKMEIRFFNVNLTTAIS